MLSRLTSFKSALKCNSSSKKTVGLKYAKTPVTNLKYTNNVSQYMRWAHKGSVKWFNIEKGIGFILRENGEKDVFFHVSEVKSDDGYKVLNEGDVLEFDIEERSRGPVATSINLIHANPNPPKRRRVVNGNNNFVKRDRQPREQREPREPREPRENFNQEHE